MHFNVCNHAHINLTISLREIEIVTTQRSTILSNYIKCDIIKIIRDFLSLRMLFATSVVKNTIKLSGCIIYAATCVLY